MQNIKSKNFYCIMFYPEKNSDSYSECLAVTWSTNSSQQIPHLEDRQQEETRIDRFPVPVLELLCQVVRY